MKQTQVADSNLDLRDVYTSSVVPNPKKISQNISHQKLDMKYLSIFLLSVSNPEREIIQFTSSLGVTFVRETKGDRGSPVIIATLSVSGP